VDAFAGHLVVSLRRDGLTALRVLPPRRRLRHRVPEPSTRVGLDDNP
jgi:oligopeptidase B